MEHIIELEGHRLANYFPSMSEEAFNGLVTDIKENGQLNPIIMYEGKILDGKNRYAACQKLGIEPIVKEYTGNDPLAFVITSNAKRRDLTPSVRAWIALEMLPEFEERTKKNKSTYINKQERKKKSLSQGDDKESNSLPGKKDRTKTASYQAGAELNVSAEMVQRAKRISIAIENGTLPKKTENEIISGERTLNGIIVALTKAEADKHKEEKEAEEGKRLPNKYPKAVKTYINNIKNYKEELLLAIKLAKEGMFAPEAIQLITTKHDEVRKLMKEMEEIE